MRILPLTALALVLTSCGYTPLYGPDSTGAQAFNKVEITSVQMQNIKIAPGERRVAQRVAEKLRQDYPHTGLNLDSLNIDIIENTATLAVEKTATISRAQITLSANVVLTNPNGDVLLRTQLNSSSAYNVQDSPYSTESGKTFARLTAADGLADEISRRLALYYAHPTPPPPPLPAVKAKKEHHKMF